MNAFLKNKAEAELLKLFKEVSDILYLDLKFEIEALDQGGIREYIRILTSPQNKARFYAVLSVFAASILAPIVSDVTSDFIKGDNEMKKLEKEKIKLEIQSLKKQLSEEKSLEENQVIINNIIYLVNETDKVKLYKSNFYKKVIDERQINQISTQVLDINNKPKGNQYFVKRENFNKLVVEEIEIESETLSDIEIEIVSPVFQKSKAKWKASYEKKPLSFNLRDLDFKQSVQTGEYSFTNGTKIKCDLEIEKKMNDNGEIKISDYNVRNVQSITSLGETIQTEIGKENQQE